MVHLWRGYHHQNLLDLLARGWENNELIILVPMHLKDFSFLKVFDGELSKSGESPAAFSLHGEWPSDIQASIPKRGSAVNERHRNILGQAILGVFTTGTDSGKPRLVFYSKENVQSSLTAIRSLFHSEKLRSIFVYPQATHTFGLVLGYLQGILNQLPVRFLEGPYSKRAHAHWLATLDEGTLTLGTPTHFMDLIAFVKAQNLTPPKSYSAILGGARVTRALWSEVQTVLNIEAPSVGYGATEASPGVTHLPPGLAPTEDGDIGFALPGVVVTSLENQGMSFAGKNLCLAILENESLQQYKEIVLKDHLRVQAFTTESPERWTFVGRTDLLINRGGLKLSLEVIEGGVASRFHRKCLALKVFDERLGEDVALFVEPSGEGENSQLQVQVQEFLQEELQLKLPLTNILLAAIPLNANSKLDRKEALRMFLRTRSWNFPIPVKHVEAFLPHREGAIWVHQILENKLDEGVLEVILNPHDRYFSEGEVRESACIEWAAQSYGYTVAMNDILGLKPASHATKTFIAEVKTCEFFFHTLATPLKEKDRVQVHVKCTHDFGVLKVVESRVFSSNTLIAKMSVKLYSAP